MPVQVPALVEEPQGPPPPHPSQLLSPAGAAPQQPQSPARSTPELPAQTTKSVPDCPMYKNRLQEYTHKTSLELPVYHTINEGAQHEPKFRSTVLVDGTPYTSQETFAQRKSAEQDAARIALENIHQKLKDESYRVIREDTTFCKSILNEYAVKMHIDMPSYQTIQMPGLLPVFVSTVDFNKVNYTGDPGKNKKEAEQLAARIVILSILDHGGSEAVNVMSTIIKSKCKLYAAVNKTKEIIGICSTTSSDPNSQEDPVAKLNKRKQTDVITSVANLSGTSISESLSNELVKEGARLPLHNFKKPKPETTMKVIAPSIDFVPSGSEQALVTLSSGAKRNRKTRKKAKRRLQIGPEMPVAMVPLTEFTPPVAL